MIVLDDGCNMFCALIFIFVIFYYRIIIILSLVFPTFIILFDRIPDVKVLMSWNWCCSLSEIATMLRHCVKDSADVIYRA